MPAASAADTAFGAWAENFAARWVRENPQLATTTQYFTGAEQRALDGALALAGAFGDTIGATSARRRAELARSGLDELRSYTATNLCTAACVSAALIEHRLTASVANARDAQLRTVFNQFNGLHTSLVSFLTTQHPLRDGADAESYLERLARMPACLDAGIAEASEAMRAASVVPPGYIADRTLAQLEGMIGVPPREHALVATLARGLSAMPAVPERKREVMLERARELVAEGVIPALERVRVLVETQRRASACEVAGVVALPNYERFYRQQLSLFTGSSKEPREIHEIGLREVARLEAEMDAVLVRLGYREGSVTDRVARLEATLVPAGGKQSRESVLVRLREIVDDAVHRSRDVFDLRPVARVTVEREPLHSEATSAAHYTVPAADGSKPGIYWVPLAELGTGVPWLGIGTKSTAYHEAVPGHHFQLAIEQESASLPYFRRHMAFGYDASFNEGWALYAEHLAAEFDWYEDDLVGRLGYLEMQLFRARRLVVDTGLHAFGWTRRQALDYGLSVPEVERYVVWPGQACSYMLGQLRILEIRARARAALGERFSLARFHDVVLASGTVPLDVLAGVVDGWVNGYDTGEGTPR